MPPAFGTVRTWVRPFAFLLHDNPLLQFQCLQQHFPLAMPRGGHHISQPSPYTADMVSSPADARPSWLSRCGELHAVAGVPALVIPSTPPRVCWSCGSAYNGLGLGKEGVRFRLWRGGAVAIGVQAPCCCRKHSPCGQWCSRRESRRRPCPSVFPLQPASNIRRVWLDLSLAHVALLLSDV